MLHDFTFKWWQVALYEICVISIGIIIGSHWADFWANYTNILWFTFAIPGIYIAYVYFQAN